MLRIKEYNRHALKTAFYFFIFGFLWILLSDKILYQVITDTSLAARFQTYKGWLFICLTAGLIFTIARRQFKMVMALNHKLSVSEQRYKQIVALSHDVIWTLNPDRKISFINQASDSFYGYQPEEMIGKRFSEFIDNETYVHNERMLNENLKKGIHSIKYNTVFTNKKGERFYFQNNVNVVFDNLGNIAEIIGASKDVTKDKLYEIELLENKQRLEIALEGGQLGLWDYDMALNLVYISEQWKEMAGITSAGNQISFGDYLGMIHPDDQEAVNNILDLFLKEKPGVFVIEYRMKHQAGSWRWIMSKGKVAGWNDQNQPVRLIGTSQDITVKKQLELDLKYWLDIYKSFIKYANEGIFLQEIKKPIEPGMSIDEQVDILFNHGYIKTCNDSFAIMYGYEHSYQMEGFTLARLQGGDQNPHNIAFLKKFIHSGYRLNNEISIDVDKEGNQLYISNNLVGIYEKDRLVRIWGSQYNITLQVLAQKKLENSERRYRLLFQTNPVPLAIVDLDSFQFYDANSAAEKLLETPREELIKMNIRDIRPDISLYSSQELKTLLRNELSKTTEVTLQVKGEKKIIAEVKTDLIEYEGNNAIIAAINDITLLREAEKMVIRSLIEGEDRERKRVAKEIHDSLGQNLTAASLNFGTIKSAIENLDKQRQEKFLLGYTFLNAAIEESRNIALNLMPKAIDDFGLVPALRSLFSQIEKSAEFKITFYENLRNEVRLPRNVELNLYRITQEALNNAIKHAHANRIFVQLLLHKKEIIYTFEDDGKGFDYKITVRESRGMGIISIKNRVMAMSGIFEIDSAPDKGTVITIQIPL
ncbi:MAG TPA: PAS domain S-box protein [Bacteroidales bacterium]|nr:PAS domain S-box protein [Bacteroidales bacterium]HRW96966.1 PAS domain S-box protein [Bacteroidales bacterium]